MISVILDKASNLPSADLNGLSDPYVKVFGVTNDTIYYMGKTNTVMKSLNPEWHHSVMVPNVCVTKLYFEVFDYDTFLSDDFLAHGEVELVGAPLSELFTINLKTFRPVKVIPTLTLRILPPETWTSDAFPKDEESKLQKGHDKFVAMIEYQGTPLKSTDHPKLKLRALDRERKPMEDKTNKFAQDYGKILTRLSTANSYLLTKSQIHYNIEFFMESFDECVVNEELEMALIIVALPECNKEIKTFTGKTAYIIQEPVTVIEIKSRDYIFRGLVDVIDGTFIVSSPKDYDYQLSRIAIAELSIRSIDRPNKIKDSYEALDKLIRSELSSPQENDKRELAFLCEKLLQKINKITNSYSTEIKMYITNLESAIISFGQ